MEKNTGIPYEHLARKIFDQIVNQNSVETIDVQHDVLLRGTKTTHQIDVYWEFEIGGIKYATIVQAKDWARPVDQGELIKFKGVLDDIPGQPRGVFVTKTDYQKGAKEFADKSGIVLYELREASEDDLRNRIQTIVIKLTAYVPYASNFNLILDDEWNVNEKKRLGLAPDDIFTMKISGMPDEILFTDGSGMRQTDAGEIINSFFPKELRELAPIIKTHMFTKDTFVGTNDHRFPTVKVKGAQAIVSVSKAQDEIRVGDDIVGFILRSVIDDSEQLFSKDYRRIK